MSPVIICVASGPSLSIEDCRLIADSQIPAIAINSTWEILPDCKWLYASDLEWWRRYHDKITIQAQRWTSNLIAARKFGVRHFLCPMRGSFNSGQRAILLASALGAKKILLVGYDCSLINGSHWHGDHPCELGNPTQHSISKWREEFQRLRSFLPTTEIINCSRYTELSVFPRANLEEELQNGSTDKPDQRAKATPCADFRA